MIEFPLIYSELIQNQYDECNGKGKIFKEKCKECQGKKVQNIKRIIEINLERGVPDKYRYKMSNCQMKEMNFLEEKQGI